MGLRGHPYFGPIQKVGVLPNPTALAHVSSISQNELFGLCITRMVAQLAVHRFLCETLALHELVCGCPSPPPLWDEVTKYPNCIAHGVCFCLQMSIELLLLPQLCLMCVSADELMNLLLSGQQVLYNFFTRLKLSRCEFWINTKNRNGFFCVLLKHVRKKSVSCVSG